MSSHSVNELRERILEEARKQAQEIIKKAKQQAQEIIRRAEEDWKRKYEDEKARILDEASKSASAIVSEAWIKRRLAVSRAKHDVIKRVFEEAIEQLRKKKNIDVDRSLRTLLTEALSYLPSGTKRVRIVVNPRDIDAARRAANEILREKRIDYEITTSNEISGGVVVETPEGMRIDNSYETRLKRAEESLVNIIAKILWGAKK